MAIFHMTTIISLGVLASFATGFLCLLVVSIKWASSVKRDIVGEENVANKSRIICARCGTSFFDNQTLGLKDVLCNDCKWPVCSACAINYPTYWLCAACIKARDSEIDKIKCSFHDIKQRFPVSDHPTRKYGKREGDVRNLVEAVAENILGDCVDNVIVNSLSEDVAYLEFMDKYEGVLSLTILRLKTSIQLIVDGVTNSVNDVPKTIEEQLRELIQDIIKEASNTNLGKGSRQNKISRSNISSKTYEDLLAIAIINKILENVSVDKVESRALVTLPDESEKHKSRVDHLDNIELESKVRELQNYTSGLTSRNKLNSTFPDLGLDLAQDRELNKRWEENWLFRRKNSEINSKKMSTYGKRTTVPMFVPSPNVYISPKIGESNVDDLSDLSDFSDTEIEQIVNKGF